MASVRSGGDASASQRRRGGRDKKRGAASDAQCVSFRQPSRHFPPVDLVALGFHRAYPQCIPEGSERDGHQRAARRSPRHHETGRCRRHGRRDAGSLRPGPGHGGHCHHSYAIHAACQEPGAQSEHRRQRDGLLPDGKRAERVLPRPRTARRHPRGLPELPQAGPSFTRSSTPSAATRSNRSTSTPRSGTSTAFPTTSP